MKMMICLIAIVLACITMFLFVFFLTSHKRSWELVADNIYLNPKNLMWAENKTDDYFKSEFKYLIYPKRDNIYIYKDAAFKTKLKLMNRAILISEGEREKGGDYFKVILNHNQDAYIKRSEICYYLSNKDIRDAYIANYNNFLDKYKDHIYWRKALCEYTTKSSGAIVAKLKVLGNRDIYVFQYNIYPNSLNNAYPKSSYVKIERF